MESGCPPAASPPLQLGLGRWRGLQPLQLQDAEEEEEGDAQEEQPEQNPVVLREEEPRPPQLRRGPLGHQPKLLRLLAPCTRVLAVRPSRRLPAHGAAPARWLQLAPLGAGRVLGPLRLAGGGRSAVRAGTWQELLGDDGDADSAAGRRLLSWRGTSAEFELVLENGLLPAKPCWKERIRG